MSKKELYELRNRLLNSEKYKMVVIEGSDDNYINLDIVYSDHTYLKENIIGSYKHKTDKDSVAFLEKSFEKIMRLLADKNISYDSIEAIICPTFFMKEYNIVNDGGKDLNVEKNLFNNGMLIDNNLVSICYLFSIKSSDAIIYDEEINRFIDRVSSAKFLVDYNSFTREVALNGFPLEDYNYDMLIQSQINNKGTSIKLDFEKEKTF